MHTIDVHYVMQAPLERVWAYIADFGNIEAWWPAGQVAIERVELEGEGIGQIRHIYNVGYPDPNSERLDFLDPASHMWKLSLVGRRPAGILQYQATGNLTPLGPGTCRITYHSEFEVAEGMAETATAFLTAVYKMMFRGLEAAGRRGQA
jgi:uncharacterized protein YndB with AHSA1/START domain